MATTLCDDCDTPVAALYEIDGHLVCKPCLRRRGPGRPESQCNQCPQPAVRRVRQPRGGMVWLCADCLAAARRFLDPTPMQRHNRDELIAETVAGLIDMEKELRP